LPDGDKLIIVYLKMQLKSLKTEGVIKYDALLPSAEEEIALMLDEDINIVKLAISSLIKLGAIEKWDNDTFYMTALQKMIGSETAVAERVRKHRELKNNTKMLQCNNNVTICNTEKREERREKREENNTYVSNVAKQVLSNCLESIEENSIEENSIYIKKPKINNNIIYKKINNLTFEIIYFKITEEQYNKLLDMFDEKDIKKYIERIETYECNRKTKYKDYYKTIINWLDKDDKVKRKYKTEEIILEG